MRSVPPPNRRALSVPPAFFPFSLWERVRVRGRSLAGGFLTLERATKADRRASGNPPQSGLDKETLSVAALVSSYATMTLPEFVCVERACARSRARTDRRSPLAADTRTDGCAGRGPGGHGQLVTMPLPEVSLVPTTAPDRLGFGCRHNRS